MTLQKVYAVLSDFLHAIEQWWVQLLQKSQKTALADCTPTNTLGCHTDRNATGGVAMGWISVFIPPKSAQVNFLWGKNNIRMAIQQFYTPKKLLYPQNKFLATPLNATHIQPL